MKTNVEIDVSSLVPYLAKLWFLIYRPNCCWPAKLQDSLKYSISGKKWMMKFIFGMQINIEVFYKMIVSFCVWIQASNYVKEVVLWKKKGAWIKLKNLPQVKTLFIYALRFLTFHYGFKLVQRAFLGGSIMFLETNLVPILL